MAAIDQGRPTVPVSIAAAADRARIEIPPVLLTGRVGYLHDLLINPPAPAFLNGLLDELTESALRLRIRAYGCRLRDNSHRGFLAEQLAMLEMVGPLVDEAKSLLAVKT